MFHLRLACGNIGLLVVSRTGINAGDSAFSVAEAKSNYLPSQLRLLTTTRTGSTVHQIFDDKAYNAFVQHCLLSILSLHFGAFGSLVNSCFINVLFD